MSRSLAALCALFAIAAVSFGAPAHAQSSRTEVIFRNTTSYCVWVTLYKKDASGPAGTLADPVQIKEEPRTNTGPLSVPAGKTYTFRIKPTRWLRLRAELENHCGSGAVYDTHITTGDAGNYDYLHYTLHKGTGNYYLTRP
ncbi:MAG TPA: hypothetical protein VFN37_06855 [Candidatus Baltobacteraceae bacterium]|nr:hypothetical protein [Candidatus Baltobacteraceae bacterium]